VIAGDCFVLPHVLPFRLASDLTSTPIDYCMVLAGSQPGVVASLNGGGDCIIIGGHFALDGKHADILLGMLLFATPIQPRPNTRRE